MEAALDRSKAGGKPVVEIMIPLTVSRAEMVEARSWVTEAISEAMKGSRRKLDVTIGTMIETPRAALRADEIAEVADFFSFGTNDLTQMTFGFSRDDVESRLMPAYLEKGLLRANPFETVDIGGVGALVEMAVERGRSTNRKLKLGVCGEQGGDPASVAFFQKVGLDYVSCSPFRVPVARLAAAQAIVGSTSSDTR
jgi:pyruvate,orthophosphate dikinase